MCITLVFVNKVHAEKPSYGVFSMSAGCKGNPESGQDLQVSERGEEEAD